MRKKISLLFSLALVLIVITFVACNGGAAPAAPDQAPATPGQAPADTDAAEPGDWVWERPVTIVNPWGIGGGIDGVLQPFRPHLEAALGVPVEIINVEGAGGANGFIHTHGQPADGYTFVMGTQSNILLDIQGLLPFSLMDEFVPLARINHAVNFIVGGPAMEGLFTDFESMIEFAQANPGVVSAGMLTATGGDAAGLMMALSGGLDLPIWEVGDVVTIVPFASGSELDAALIGGHVHLMVGSFGEFEAFIESGDVTPLIALAEQRVSAAMDIPSSRDLGIQSYVGPWRAIWARVDTPEAAQQAMMEAFYQAWWQPEYQEFLESQGYLDRGNIILREELVAMAHGEYPELTQYLQDMGLI